MARAPLVLIVSEHEWASRSLSAVLTPRGFAVLRAYNARQAIERAAGTDPDAVFVDRRLPDLDGPQLCRTLLEQNLVSRSAPIILVTSGPMSREDRLQAFEAGAWDVVVLPVDAEELLLRIDRYVGGKLESDRLKEEALVDPATGLYTWHGVSRRVRELASAAERFGRPLACVVFFQEDADRDAEIPAERAASIAEMLRASTRQSDVLARIGPGEFAVLAPDTPPEGAEILAERLRDWNGNGKGNGHGEKKSQRFRAGVYAVSDLRQTRLDPMELILRASMVSRGPAVP